MRPFEVTRAGLMGTLLILVVAALCLRLGFWQLARLQERRDANRVIAERLALPPLDAARLGPDTTGVTYRRVRVRGRADNGRTLILAGQTMRGSPGVHVITPVQPAGGSRPVLVNRGWAPSADARSVDLATVPEPDSVDFVGVALPLSGQERVSADPRVLRSISARAVARALPYDVAPIVVRVIGGLPSPGYPRALPPPELGDGSHFSYAVQWFSFAGIALIGWLALVLQRRRTQEG